MSLILDALRKVERENAARDPGVLVVGSVPWGGTSSTRRLLLAAGACAVLALAVWVGWLLRPAAPPTAVAPPVPARAAAEPRPLPSPTLPAPAPPLPAAARYDLPAAPPIRLSRPVSRPTSPVRVDPSANTVPASPPVEAAPEPAVSITSGAAAASDAPAAEAPAAPGELRLTAISQRDGRPVAMINDRLVFEGDSFEGVRVLRIGDAEVEVEVHGQRRVLRF